MRSRRTATLSRSIPVFRFDFQMNNFQRHTIVALMAAVMVIACAASNTGVQKVTETTKQEGMRDPKTPHPGAITFVYLWNGTRETKQASDWPERMAWYCTDSDKREVARSDSRATRCIPIVEIETLSVDENGKPVAPSEADFISIKEYGPNHTFVRSTSSPPSLKQRSEQMPKPDGSMHGDMSSDTQPQSYGPSSSSPSLDVSSAARRTSSSYGEGVDKPSGFWERIKKAIRGI
jgi:hypothetical protein